MQPIGDPLRRERRSNRKRGQSMVEFALVLPIFMLVLSGILDFGFALYSRMTVISAAREGARAAIMVPDNTTIVSTAQAAAISAGAAAGLTLSAPTVTCIGHSSDCHDAQAGDSVLVRVNFSYHSFFPLSFGAAFDLSSSVQMVIEF